jgi:hypothetical protein
VNLENRERPLEFTDPTGLDAQSFYELLSHASGSDVSVISENYDKIVNDQSVYTFDVNVRLPGDGENPDSSIENGDGGHAFISLKKYDAKAGEIASKIVGYYGVPPLDGVFFGSRSFPGDIMDDSKTRCDFSKKYDITEEGYNDARLFVMLEENLNPEYNRYNLWTHNCVDFATTAGSYAGVAIPESGVIGTWLSNPYNLYRNLVNPR